MFEPGPPATSPEELLGREVELIEVELRRVDQRLRSLGWSAPAPRLRPAERWDEIALGFVPGSQDDGDHVAREVLSGKRNALLQRLGELRARLIGQAAGHRRGDDLAI